MENEIYKLKYTILRRAIQYGKTFLDSGVPTKKYTIEELETLSCLLEGKNEEQLKELHEEWIGY